MKKREERKGKDEKDWGNARIRRKSYEDLEEIERKRNEDEIVRDDSKREKWRQREG